MTVVVMKMIKNQLNLSIYNPLNYFKLLWISLLQPNLLNEYKKKYGSEDILLIGKWLISILMWLPLLILSLGLCLNLLPINTNSLSSFQYGVISVFILLCILGNGLFDSYIKSDTLIWSINVIIGLFIVIFLAGSLSFSFKLVFAISIGIAIGVIGVIENNIESAVFKWTSRVVFVILSVNYIFLIWFVFFGGWSYLI